MSYAGFSNPGDAPTRLLDIYAPDGFENYFRELAVAFGSGPPNPKVTARIASRYDIRLA